MRMLPFFNFTFFFFLFVSSFCFTYVSALLPCANKDWLTYYYLSRLNKHLPSGVPQSPPPLWLSGFDAVMKAKRQVKLLKINRKC